MRMVLLAVLVLACTACSGGGSGGVVASFYPLAWAASAVGARDVTNLTPPGAEPHDVELTPREVARLQRARVLLYLGGGFQPAVEDAARDAQGRRVDLSNAGDPHVWLDPVRFAAIVARVATALGRDGTPAVARVRALDGAYRRGLAHCRTRTFVTTHAAFGHLAQRYGLRQLSITGLDPESETAPRKLGDLIHLVRRERISTVFFEPLVSHRLAATVAGEAGARAAVLDPIESATGRATYLSLMRANLRALEQALGCR